MKFTYPSAENQVEDDYDLDYVVERMLARRERRIPGSVYKPHADNVILIQSASLGQPKSSARIFFAYPKYCFVDSTKLQQAQAAALELKPMHSSDNSASLQLNQSQKQESTSADMKQGESFMQVVEWHKGQFLKEFQKIKSAQQDYFLQMNMTLGFKVTESTHIYNSVVNSMKVNGVRIVSPATSKWNVMWTGVTRNDYLKDASKYQKINHFP